MALHPKQLIAKNTQATEVLYGGAAGGGKSHLMRAAAIEWCTLIPGLQVYLFRRIYDDLVKNHMEGRQGFHALLAPYVAAGLVDIVEGEIRFKHNNSNIFLCHCQHDNDRWKYQGAEMDVLLIDELTHFPAHVYTFLRSRLRQAGLQIPAKYPHLHGRFPRILCSANPGNIGHLWVKKAWIAGKRQGHEYQIGDPLL